MALGRKKNVDVCRRRSPHGQKLPVTAFLSRTRAERAVTSALRAIGVTGPKRSPLLPNVPTLQESGATGYNFETWFMAFTPANTPKPAIDKLNAALNRVISSPDLKDRLIKDGFNPLPSTPAQAQARLMRELPAWNKLIKERGISAE